MDVREKLSNEKRLIDANALIKEAYVDGAYGYVDAEQIANAPTIDAVEVVRCKECKYSYDDLDGLCCTYGVCIDSIVPEDFYCSYGEQRGGGEDG